MSLLVRPCNVSKHWLGVGIVVWECPATNCDPRLNWWSCEARFHGFNCCDFLKKALRGSRVHSCNLIWIRINICEGKFDMSHPDNRNIPRLNLVTFARGTPANYEISLLLDANSHVPSLIVCGYFVSNIAWTPSWRHRWLTTVALAFLWTKLFGCPTITSPWCACMC